VAALAGWKAGPRRPARRTGRDFGPISAPGCPIHAICSGSGGGSLIWEDIDAGGFAPGIGRMTRPEWVNRSRQSPGQLGHWTVLGIGDIALGDDDGYVLAPPPRQCQPGDKWSWKWHRPRVTVVDSRDGCGRAELGVLADRGGDVLSMTCNAKPLSPARFLCPRRRPAILGLYRKIVFCSAQQGRLVLGPVWAQGLLR